MTDTSHEDIHTICCPHLKHIMLNAHWSA